MKHHLIPTRGQAEAPATGSSGEEEGEQDTPFIPTIFKPQEESRGFGPSLDSPCAIIAGFISQGEIRRGDGRECEKTAATNRENAKPLFCGRFECAGVLRSQS